MDKLTTNKLIIGFITYGKATAKYLPYFLSSLKEQTWQDFKIIAVDNSEVGENENISLIKNNYPEVEIERAGKNLGFGQAYNRMIVKAINYGVKYFLIINSDMIAEPTAIETMIQVLENDKAIGAVCPKVLRWEFENNKKINIIDTLGIKLLPGLRFVDLGQCLADDGRLEKEVIIGPSGAAGMFRLEVLKKIADGGKYFDELMFMYKEDCDLAYRLKLANIKVKLVSEAVIYHDRTTKARGESNLDIALNRKNKNKQVKIWSFKNQLIIYYKYWYLQNIYNKLMILWQLFKILMFALLFEPYLLKIFVDFSKIKNEAKQFKSV